MIPGGRGRSVLALAGLVRIWVSFQVPCFLAEHPQDARLGREDRRDAHAQPRGGLSAGQALDGRQL
jgi:hypothetical protein